MFFSYNTESNQFTAGGMPKINPRALSKTVLITISVSPALTVDCFLRPPHRYYSNMVRLIAPLFLPQKFKIRDVRVVRLQNKRAINSRKAAS